MNRYAIQCVACLLAGTAAAQPLEVVIQSGHLAEIRDIAYSPNGCLLATAGADNRVKLWDETTGKEVRSFRGGNRPNTDVTFSANGRTVFIGVQGGAATQWDIASGEKIREFAAEESASVAMDDQRKSMITTGGDRGSARDIVLWNVSSGAKRGTYSWPTSGAGSTARLDDRHKAIKHQPNRVEMSPNGDYFATVGQEGRTALWKTGNNVPIRFFHHESALDEDGDIWDQIPQLAVAFSPDGAYVAGAISNEGHLWPVDSGSEKTLRGHNSAISSIAFSDDGLFVATGTNSGEVKIWDVAAAQELSTFQAQAGAVYALAFKPTGEDVLCKARLANAGSQLSGRILATSGADSVARIWSLGDESAMIRALTPKVQPLNDVAFSPDGTKLAMASSAWPNGSVKIWDLTSGYDVTAISGHDGGVNSVRFSPDGKRLATAGVDNTTVIWDANTMTLDHRIGKQAEKRTQDDILAVLVGILILSNETAAGVIGNSSISAALSTIKHSISKGARALAFSPDGRYLALGGARNTKIYDFEKSGLVGAGIGINSMDKVAFTPNGRELLIGGIGSYRIDVETGAVLHKLASRFIGNSAGAGTVELRPDGTRFAIAYDDGRVAVRKFRNSNNWRSHRGTIPVRALKFSSDGNLLVAGDEAGNILIFEIGEKMVLKKEWQAHTDIVFGLDFSPDESVLASASSDGTVILWDTRTWEKKLTFVSIGSEDYVILAPDNHYVASTNGHLGLAFRRGNTIYPFEQFDLQLNRPDIVFSRLGSVSDELLEGYRNAYEKRLRRYNLTPTDTVEFAQLPSISILNLPKRSATTERTLTFDIEAIDLRHGINTINVWVNDVPLYGSAGFSLPGRPHVERRPVNLELSAGRNKIQISATNSRGTESVRTTIETVYVPPESARPDLHVVAIGVSDYLDDRMNLDYAAKDAADLVGALTKQKRFRNIHKTLLIDGDATREKILDVKLALQRTGVNDEVVLFVAGHGILDSNLDYYFATHDVGFNDPGKRGLSYEQLESLLDGIPARRKLLLMDTCYSGEIDDEADVNDPEAEVAEDVIVNNVRGIQIASNSPPTTHTNSFDLMQKMFANLGRGSGAAVLSAAGGDEFAYEGEVSTNGVFTYSVIEAIASTDKDDHMRLSQLRQIVVARVRELTGGQQTPSTRRVNLEFDYPFYSRNKPKLSDEPEYDSFDFENLFKQAAEISLLQE